MTFERFRPSRPTIGPLVVGVQIGQARDYAFGLRQVRSAIGKLPVSGPIRIERLGLAGDEQVNRRIHGGPERAVCVYPMEHLIGWEAELGIELPPGSFGENLTLTTLHERSVHLGDRFRFGSALLEVSQPREPCTTLAGRIGQPDLPKWITRNRRTGWYMRVVEPGEAAVGLPFALEASDPHAVSVAEAFAVRVNTHARWEEVRRILDVPGLSSGWRVSLEKRR